MESKQLWVLCNFSRFIRPGMQRVEAIADSTPGADSLLISAWQDEANNKLVMVIVNESGEERGLCLPATSHQAPVEVFTTDVRRNLEKSRSEEHTSELQSLMRISYAVFCLKKQK